MSSRMHAVEPGPEYTIDQLARATGMTVRNIRAHQSRGLLPPPAVRGRTGYYGPEHVARLELISSLQNDGFNLNAIKRVLAATPEGTAREVLDFNRAVRAAWEEERPEIVGAEELRERFGGDRAAELTRRAERLGLLTPLADGSFEVESPALLAAGADAVSLGIPVEATLAVLEQLHRSADAVARAFVRLFLTEVWAPFDEAGRPEAEWPRIREALDRLRPLALQSLDASFRMAMTRATDHAFGRVLQSQGRARAVPRSRRRR